MLEYTKKTKPLITTTRIVTNPKLAKSSSIIDLDRASILYSGVKSFIDYVMNNKGLKVFAYEVPGGSQSQRAAACLGMAKGVIGSVLSQQSFEDIEAGSWMRAPIMPTEVHKQAVGKNKATKEDIIAYVLDKYADQVKFINKKYAVYHYSHSDASIVTRYTKGEFEHIADAIVIAECGYSKIGVKS